MDILLNIALGIFGAFFALWYSNLGSSRLRIQLKPSKKGFLGEKEECIFLNLFVKNEPLTRIPFVKRETAHSCHGDITFYNESGKAIGKPMTIRWAGNPQPVRYEIYGNEIKTLPEPNLIKSSGYIDIPADEQEEMDVAVRFLEETEAYGWNSYSHFKRGRNPDYRLTCGTYTIEVKIICGNDTKTEKFVLTNPEDIAGFQLSTLPKVPFLKRIFKRR